MIGGISLTIKSTKGSLHMREVDPKETAVKLGKTAAEVMEIDGKDFPQSMVLEAAFMDIDPAEITEIEIG